MRFNIMICLAFLLTASSQSYAFFCPTNFNQIDYGMTMDQVSNTCGKPDLQESKDVAQEGPQEWSYFIPQTVSSTTLSPMQGTLKTQITFDGSGSAINISVNGIGVGSTTVCGSQISLGNSRDQIKAACGNPSFVNKQSPSDNLAMGGTPPGDKITTFLYKSNPPVKLIFKNGILTEKQ